MGDAAPTAPLLQVQRILFSKVATALSQSASWDAGSIHAAWLYTRLINYLLEHSATFATRALESQLLHKLLRSFPFPVHPFLSWATSTELASVTNLAIQQAYTLVCLHGNTVEKRCELRIDDLALVGDWLDRFLAFLDAVWGPLLACGDSARAASAVEFVLQFVDIVAGPKQVFRAIFAPPRREALLRAAERFAALGKENERLGRQFVEKVERAELLGTDYSVESGSEARASGARAESLLEKLRVASRRRDDWQCLHELQEEVQKVGWGAQETSRLAKKGCFPLLFRVLEGEDVRADRRAGPVIGTFQGPIWPALHVFAVLAEPFSDPDGAGGKEFCQELAESAPRLLRYAEGAAGALGILELRALLQALFTAFELSPRERWESRWRLLDVLLVTTERYLPEFPGSGRVWQHVYELLPFIFEPSDETRGLIAKLNAAPIYGAELRGCWARLELKLVIEASTGDAMWAPDVRKRRLASVALTVLNRGKATMADPQSPVSYAASTLVFCCRCSEVLCTETADKVGVMVECLAAAYAGMARLVRTCESRAPDKDEKQQWHSYWEVTTKLSSCLRAAFKSELLKGGVLDDLACSGGVGFAAEVLRTRGGARNLLRKVVPAGEDRTEALRWLEELATLALRLWGELSPIYGLKRCSNQVGQAAQQYYSACTCGSGFHC